MFHHRSRSNRLDAYSLRTILTLIGPLFVLGFYAFICFYYLQNPPSNQIIAFQAIDGRWAFYVWFIVATLSLEWARTGLANIEAGAIMHCSFAPRTASQLMWHVDMNWSNLLWWPRYIVAVAQWVRNTCRSPATEALDSVPLPNALWVALSFTTALLVVAITLSGLSMELTTVSMPSDVQVAIYGTNETAFNYQLYSDLIRQINSNWRSGRKSSPSDRSIFYAPAGASNVSRTYFDDQAAANAESIQTFLGPAVHENVIGEAWGIFTNISCRTARAQNLQLINVLETDVYSIYGFSQPLDGSSFGPATSSLSWLDLSVEKSSIIWPTWVSETTEAVVLHGAPSHDAINAKASLIAAGDGFSGFQQGCTEADAQCWLNGFWTLQRPGRAHYSDPYAHDNWTLDSWLNGRSHDQPTTAMFELYTTQPVSNHNPRSQSYLSTWTDIDVLPLHTWDYVNTPHNWTDGVSVGVGVHCDIVSIPGLATLNPALRTYSSFQHVPASSLLVDTDKYWEVSSIGVLALGALSSAQRWGSVFRPLKPRPETDILTPGVPPSVLSIYNSLGITLTSDFNVLTPTRPILTPANIQQAIYKLLGESLITTMQETNREPWTSPSLYKLQQTRYIVSGIIPWQPIFVLFIVWAAIMCTGALWLMFLSGPRWAPTLNGFELFKFGAQYGPEISDFKFREFRECAGPLTHIPGMVGALPGDESLISGQNRVFVGLSKDEVTKQRGDRKHVEVVFDRKKAAKLQP